jgi:hypothetical protein
MALQPGDLKKLQMQQDLLTLGSEGQAKYIHIPPPMIFNREII